MHAGRDTSHNMVQVDLGALEVLSIISSCPENDNRSLD
jgi:hypothetical protein